eukprot:147691-Rhodomonas_salina.1
MSGTDGPHRDRGGSGISSYAMNCTDLPHRVNRPMPCPVLTSLRGYRPMIRCVCTLKLTVVPRVCTANQWRKKGWTTSTLCQRSRSGRHYCSQIKQNSGAICLGKV